MRYLLLFLLIFVFSCGDNHYFYKEKEMDEDNIWTYDNYFQADFDVQDSMPYDIYLELKHTDDYPFENIYLRIIDNFKAVKDTDVVNMNLSDTYGIWYGNKNGNTYTYPSLLRKSFKFSNKGLHSIKIEQFTRRDSLEGVATVRFYINKINSDK